MTAKLLFLLFSTKIRFLVSTATVWSIFSVGSVATIRSGALEPAYTAFCPGESTWNGSRCESEEPDPEPSPKVMREVIPLIHCDLVRDTRNKDIISESGELRRALDEVETVERAYIYAIHYKDTLIQKVNRRPPYPYDQDIAEDDEYRKWINNEVNRHHGDDLTHIRINGLPDRESEYHSTRTRYFGKGISGLIELPSVLVMGSGEKPYIHSWEDTKCVFNDNLRERPNCYRRCQYATEGCGNRGRVICPAQRR